MNAERLKALVRKEAERKKVLHQSLYDAFFFECFLRRLSQSGYRDSFILKGGFLLESIFGIARRTTMDMDLKCEGMPLEDEALMKAMESICSIADEDGVSLRVLGISEIAAETKYGGKSARIEARLGNLRKIFSIDVAAGDAITPHPDRFLFHPVLEGEDFEILSYNRETVLAEKFEALFAKGLNNSRAKDLFDISLLMGEDFDDGRLEAAIINTFHGRGTELSKPKMRKTLEEIRAFPFRREVYDAYLRKSPYARDVTFDEAMESCFSLLERLQEFPKIAPKKGTSITLIRHGEDEPGKVGGWSDNALTPNGVAQASLLAERLGKDYDLIISSDLRRCRQTAEIIGERIGCPIVYDEGLREVDNGDYRDLSVEEFERRGCKRFLDLGMDESYPGGESPSSFFRRVKQAYLAILDGYAGRKLAIVTHGGCLSVILCLLKGWRYSNMLKIAPPYGGRIDLPSDE